MCVSNNNTETHTNDYTCTLFGLTGDVQLLRAVSGERVRQSEDTAPRRVLPGPLSLLPAVARFRL